MFKGVKVYVSYVASKKWRNFAPTTLLRNLHTWVLNNRANYMLPKRRFWKEEQKMNAAFRSTFQGWEYSMWATNHGKVLRTVAFHLLFLLPKSSFGRGKLDTILFNHFSFHCILARLLSTHVWKFMAPKRRFWDAERNARWVFSKHLSTFRGPNPVLKPLISASKKLIEMF